MNHYVYEITNLINGKKYIGKRSCKCDIGKDKYMGSGKILKLAIEKYGIENFKKDIIEICESEKHALEMEKILIKDADASNSKNKNYYNICEGGLGGTWYNNLSDEEKEKVRERITRNNYKMWNNRTYEEKLNIRKKMSRNRPCYKGENHPRYGMKLSEETKEKIRKSNTGKKHSEETLKKLSIINKGEKNNMFGKNHTLETREKMREKATGRKHSKKTIEKLKNIALRSGDSVHSKKVILVNTLEVFNCIIEASLKYSVCNSSIGQCCNGIIRSAGKLNGEKMVWNFLDDYNNGIDKAKPMKNKNNKKIIKMPTLDIFKSITEASEICDISFSKISRSCSGKYPKIISDDGSEIRFMYYKDYLKEKTNENK